MRGTTMSKNILILHLEVLYLLEKRERKYDCANSVNEPALNHVQDYENINTIWSAHRWFTVLSIFESPRKWKIITAPSLKSTSVSKFCHEIVYTGFLQPKKYTEGLFLSDSPPWQNPERVTDEANITHHHSNCALCSFRRVIITRLTRVIFSAIDC